ncbi:MAG TPA: hypothetical protein VNH18_28540 [Bryobacteraceae bacterium]|nr:hypothetical protein [Bryobacteraceae bacterium]
MANFTKKVFGLAGAAVVFAGMAFGQATCASSATTNIIRAEGTTEQVAQLTIKCSTGATTTALAGLASLQVFLSPALPVTSKVLSTTSGATEAVAVVLDATNTPVAQTAPTYSSGTQLSATVSGSTINFSGLVIPVLANSQSFTITISNVRVNATSLSVGSGVPPAISETAFISGSAGSIVPAALASTQVAFAQNGLGTSSLFKTWTTVATVAGAASGFPNGTGTTAGANNFVICNAYSPRINAVNLATNPAAATTVVAGSSMAFAVRVNENFASAFKSIAGESSTVVNGTNAVTNGTRFQVNFANVPNGVSLFVPNGVLTSTNGSAATAQLTSSAAGTALAPVTGSTSASITTSTGLTSGGASSLAPVALSSGAGSAVFEIIVQDPNNLDRFDIPVFVVTTANSVPGSATALTASVSLSPTGSTVIPNFAVGGSTTTLTASAFNICSTSLLFPFVTNQLGFDTGIAIANTSTDPFGAAGATAQAGTCSLNFYGAGAPSPANVTTPNVPTGTVYTQVLSGVAAGFQGYIIAQCNFQYAHGFAFITDGVGVNGGLSQGYLAGVIPDVNQVNRQTGTGESLAN